MKHKPLCSSFISREIYDECDCGADQIDSQPTPSVDNTILPEKIDLPSGMSLIDFSVCGMCGRSYKRTEGHKCSTPSVNTDWEKEFDERFISESVKQYKDQIDIDKLGLPMVAKDVKSFIRSLLASHTSALIDEVDSVLKKMIAECACNNCYCGVKDQCEGGWENGFYFCRQTIINHLAALKDKYKK